MFMRGIVETKGIIGENVKHLKGKYDIPETAFVHDLQGIFHRINVQNKPGHNAQSAADQVVELLTCHIYTMRIVHPDRYHLLKSTDWHHVLENLTSTEFLILPES